MYFDIFSADKPAKIFKTKKTKQNSYRMVLHLIRLSKNANLKNLRGGSIL